MTQLEVGLLILAIIFAGVSIYFRGKFNGSENFCDSLRRINNEQGRKMAALEEENLKLTQELGMLKSVPFSPVVKVARYASKPITVGVKFAFALGDKFSETEKKTIVQEELINALRSKFDDVVTMEIEYDPVYQKDTWTAKIMFYKKENHHD